MAGNIQIGCYRAISVFVAQKYYLMICRHSYTSLWSLDVGSDIQATRLAIFHLPYQLFGGNF